LLQGPAQLSLSLTGHGVISHRPAVIRLTFDWQPSPAAYKLCLIQVQWQQIRRSRVNSDCQPLTQTNFYHTTLRKARQRLCVTVTPCIVCQHTPWMTH